MSVDVIRRITSGIVLAGLCVSGLACGERQLIAVRDDAGTGLGGSPGGWQSFPGATQRQVDILFMVDNSLSMAPLQAKMNAAFPAFIDTLRALPGGPPDMHIAVISSDTGPGKYDLPDKGCSFGGDRGTFQASPRGACATSPLPPGQMFLRNINGVPNYSGDITDAFTCIAALGDRGCGFEGPLKSVRWALDASNPANESFLRPQAELAVILITNEDDCSAPDDSDLFDPTQTLMSDRLGPFNSFRCNQFGHLCQINGALRPPPRGAADDLQGCVSNETATGKLTRVADEVKFLKGLKSDPGKILAAAVTGPVAPYGIEMVQVGSDIEIHPVMKHSCSQSTGEYADPPVRIQQWVNAFGSNGMMLPICADSMAPQLEAIAQRIGQSVGTMCVTGPFSSSGGSTQPDCRAADGTSGDVGQLIPNCLDSSHVTPCWTTSDDPACPGGTKLLTIDRGMTSPPPGVGVEFTCAPCPTDKLELGCPFSPHRDPDGGPFP